MAVSSEDYQQWMVALGVTNPSMLSHRSRSKAVLLDRSFLDDEPSQTQTSTTHRYRNGGESQTVTNGTGRTTKLFRETHTHFFNQKIVFRPKWLPS